MLNVALLAEDRQHIYVWPPGQSKPARRKCEGVFEPERGYPQRVLRARRMTRRVTVLDPESRSLAESLTMGREPSSSQLLWQNSKARINVLTAFGVFGTTLAYSTYFQARSGENAQSLVLVLLLTSFSLYLCGTVGSVGLQLAFTDDKPSTLTYVHWLTLPLDFLTCILMTSGTVMLTQAIAWTMVSSKAAFWIVSAMGITPFVAVWWPAVLVIRRNWGVVWPAMCDASTAMHGAFFQMLSFRYQPLRDARGKNTARAAAAPAPTPLSPEAQQAQGFLNMYAQYGGALHYFQKKLHWQDTLDEDARATTFLNVVKSLCPQSNWEIANDRSGDTKPPCLEFLRQAKRWIGVAEEMHRLSAAPGISASSHDDQVNRFLDLEKVLYLSHPEPF